MCNPFQKTCETRSVEEHKQPFMSRSGKQFFQTTEVIAQVYYSLQLVYRSPTSKCLYVITFIGTIMRIQHMLN